jgi:hypothetical protein
VITRQHGRFGEQEECESLFIAPCCYFFWGFNRLSALHTIFLSSFLLTLFLISTYWNSKDNIIHNGFIFLCKHVAGCWWLMPAVLAAQVVEIRRIVVPCQPGQIVPETLSWKNPSWKRTGGVAQLVAHEFKYHFHKKSVQSDKCMHIYYIFTTSSWWNMFLEHTHYMYVAGVMLYNVHIGFTSYICANLINFPD